MAHILELAHLFMVNNARLLERRLFACLFYSGDCHLVRSALLAYQNADGGFGNALEPDKRTGTSQPIDQEVALRVLDDSGFDTAIALQVCDFLDTITTAEGGVPFVLPTVRDAPRAGWWDLEGDTPPAAITPTASLAALLHKYDVQHPWRDRATDFCWQYIEHRDVTSGDDFVRVMMFLEHAPDRARAERAFERVSQQLVTGGYVTTDPAAEGYVFMPLDLAPTPHSWYRQLFDDATIARHLDALVDKQQDDGGWPISWGAISPACELEGRGIVTINALKTLMAYQHLP
jgi:hypothetical protein